MKFHEIMLGLNITDPLILEEQILDSIFNIRRLKKEVAVLRRTKGKEMFFRKQKVDEESKTTAESIRQMEQKLLQSKNQVAEDSTLFAQNFKSSAGLLTMDEIQSEYDRLIRTKEELQIDYAEKQALYKQTLFSFDQRYNDIVTQAETVKIDRERK